jgi:hypothetical protein
LLSHPWITTGDEELKAKDLSKSIEAMKKYKAKLRFKAVTNVVIMTNRMKGGFKSKSAGQMVPSPDGSTAPQSSEDFKDIPEIGELRISDSPPAGATEPPSPHTEAAEDEEQVLDCLAMQCPVLLCTALPLFSISTILLYPSLSSFLPFDVCLIALLYPTIPLPTLPFALLCLLSQICC